MLAQASSGWLWLAWIDLALPWSGLDYWPQLAQADQDWACQGKLTLAHPDPDLSGRDLVLVLSGSGSGMVRPQM